MQGRGNLGWFHMQVLKEVMEQVAFDDFVLASNPCESASLAPVCTARCSQAWHSLPEQAGCQLIHKFFWRITLPVQLLTGHNLAA